MGFIQSSLGDRISNYLIQQLWNYSDIFCLFGFSFPGICSFKIFNSFWQTFAQKFFNRFVMKSSESSFFFILSFCCAFCSQDYDAFQVNFCEWWKVRVQIRLVKPVGVQLIQHHLLKKCPLIYPDRIFLGCLDLSLVSFKTSGI